MKTLTPERLDALAAAAQTSPRRRANCNLHDTLEDPVQRLAIAMEPDTLVLPHRHPQTWEVLFPLRGRFDVLHFDETGRLTRRTRLGETAAVLETPPGEWHAVRSLDPGGIIFEVKTGPYRPLGAPDLAAWAGDDSPENGARLRRWYADALIGERLEGGAG